MGFALQQQLPRIGTRRFTAEDAEAGAQRKPESTGKIVFSLMTSFTGRYQDILYTRRESERGIRR